MSIKKFLLFADGEPPLYVQASVLLSKMTGFQLIVALGDSAIHA
jgi:hypothetical protein